MLKSTLAHRMGALALRSLPLLAASCGGGGGSPAELTNRGYQTLNGGDPGGALTTFREALAGLEPSNPDYLRAKMGEVEALIQVNPEEARDVFLRLGSQVDDGHYTTVASKMTSAKAYEPAITVLDVGVKRFGESPKLLEMLKRVREEAEKSGDEGALKALEGLGYL